MNIPDPLRQRFVGVFGLGAQTGFYTPRKGGRWWAIAFGLILLGAGAVAIGGGAVYTYLQVDRLGPAVQGRAIREMLLPLSCAGLFMVGLAALLFWRTY